MFLHMPTFKRLIKAAFRRDCLRIGNLDGGLLVNGGTFAAWFRNDMIPNKVKAAVMELAGELPANGEIFKATKDGNQYEISKNPVWNIHHSLEEADKRYVVTPVVLNDSRYDTFRFLQRAGGGAIHVIKEEFISLIDLGELDYSHGEDTLEGPYGRDDGMMFFWKTEFCVLCVFGVKLYRGIARKIRNSLADVDFENQYMELEDKK